MLNNCTKIKSSEEQHILDFVLSAVLQNTPSGHLKIYPNPVAENLNIQLNKPMSNPVRLRIEDITGGVMLNRELREQKSSINVFSYATGIYIIILIDKNEYARIKFIKL